MGAVEVTDMATWEPVEIVLVRSCHLRRPPPPPPRRPTRRLPHRRSRSRRPPWEPRHPWRRPPTPLLLSQQEVSTAIRDLAIAVQGIRLYLIGTQGMTTPPLPPALNAYSAAPAFPPVQGVPAPPPASPPPPPWSSWQPAPSAGPASLPQGVPIQRVPFPPSPSRLPAWVTATEPPPVYSSASAPPVYTPRRGPDDGPVLQMPTSTGLRRLRGGFGAVLHQGDGPLAFFSRPFAARHLKLAAYERN
ncbi:hypothetical protein QYE76_067265 [Lolium multiflorum]|uniref:Uncharacterized protein n=1 Tax=Lolium multiflorum TaxID=4521 RepID=A0AAD8WBI4_LOLMU|nr:hypothetical protein QYE76_067265 [Lolium multiflorum]